MNEITKENILSAIDEIKKNGVGNRPSTTYDLVYEGISYPPKLVISIANRFATGVELDYNTFKGGKNTPAFELLSREGFVITPKIKTDNITNFTALVTSLNEYLKSSDSIISNFTIQPHKPKAKYIWLSDDKNIIGDYNCHYELIERMDSKNKKGISVEIHFEDNLKTKYFKNLEDKLPNETYWNSNHKGGKSITYKSNFSYDDPYLLSKIEDSIIYLEKKLGDKLRRLKGMKYSIEEIQNKFKEYLEKITDRPKTVTNYLGAITTISKLIQPTVFIDKTVFEIQDLTSLNILSNILKSNDKYIELNTNGKSMYNASLNHYQSFITQLNISTKNQPQNQIFYGPPGTGKTFKLQQIINDWELNKTIETIKDYNSFAKNYRWWEIIALALHEKGNITVPEIAMHPLIIAKLGSSNVKFLNTRLWTCLQNHTVDNCENVKLAKRVGEKVFFKESNSLWRLDNNEFFEEIYTPLIDAYKDFKKHDQKKSKDYTFTTCHQSLSYEDFIEGIKPVLNEENEENESNVSYEIRKGIFYNACEKAVQKAGFINLKDCLDRTKEDREKLFDIAIAESKIHVIFLDEINRCNVSNVFGELITLIEEDKRLGKTNEITDVTLPYSQDEFGVPANLFIVGTMNTADRSIEALDTALRRRFCFEEMPPLYDLEGLQNSIFKYSASDILKTINTRIEKLLDKDHKIGHSYLLNKNESSIIESFYKNIIPLLQEYFFGDYTKLGLVLGKGFVHLQEEKASTNIFADFYDAPDDFDNKNIYEIIDYRKDEEIIFKDKHEEIMSFEKALKILMNK